MCLEASKPDHQVNLKPLKDPRKVVSKDVFTYVCWKRQLTSQAIILNMWYIFRHFYKLGGFTLILSSSSDLFFSPLQEKNIPGK